MRPLVARCHLGLGLFLRHAGQHERADEQLTAAARCFTEIGLAVAGSGAADVAGDVVRRMS